MWPLSLSTLRLATAVTNFIAEPSRLIVLAHADDVFYVPLVVMEYCTSSGASLHLPPLLPNNFDLWDSVLRDLLQDAGHLAVLDGVDLPPLVETGADGQPTRRSMMMAHEWQSARMLVRNAVRLTSFSMRDLLLPLGYDVRTKDPAHNYRIIKHYFECMRASPVMEPVVSNEMTLAAVADTDVDAAEVAEASLYVPTAPMDIPGAIPHAPVAPVESDDEDEASMEPETADLAGMPFAMDPITPEVYVPPTSSTNSYEYTFAMTSGVSQAVQPSTSMPAESAPWFYPQATQVHSSDSGSGDSDYVQPTRIRTPPPRHIRPLSNIHHH